MAVLSFNDLDFAKTKSLLMTFLLLMCSTLSQAVSHHISHNATQSHTQWTVAIYVLAEADVAPAQKSGAEVSFL